MADIPTVPGSDIDINTPPRAAHISPAVAGMRFRGAEAMAGAFSDVGGVAQGLEADLERARDARIAADTDLRMRAARQSFLEGLKNNSDEGSWMGQAQTMATKVQEDVYAAHPDISPRMRPQVDQGFKAWQGSLMTETQNMVNAQTINRAWSASQQDFNEKLKDGDAQGAMATLRLARHTQIADPAELDDMERDIPKTIARNFIENGLGANPKGTQDLLNAGGHLPALDQNGKPIVASKVFSPKEYETLLNTARIRTEAWQRSNSERTLKDDVDPVTGLVPDEVLRNKMANGEISEKFGNNQIKAQDEAVKKKSREDSIALHKKDEDKYNLITARAHDPVAWGSEPDEYAHMLTQDAAGISDPALKQKAINEATHQLAAVKKTGTTADTPVQKQIFELMNTDMKTQGAMLPVSVEDVAGTPAVHHYFSPDEAAVPGTTKYTHVAGGLQALDKLKEDGSGDPWPYPGMTKDQVKDAVEVHSMRLQGQMHEWFKTEEGQKATFEQANDHRKELERPYVMDVVRNSLTKRAPIQLTKPDEAKNLPSGTPFLDPSGTLRYAK